MGELLLGKPLMSGKNELDQVQKMVRAVVDITPSSLKQIVNHVLCSLTFLDHQTLMTGR